ncbi:MAG: hypothetical protein MUC95_10070, partial [Spirochaetes bacterium]|nr:hypothetical protein [Spirochaetota bacterium]
LSLLAGFFIGTRYDEDYMEIMAVTGATPVALKKRVPSEISLKLNGLVKQEYVLSGDALNALATTRLRTQETAPDGKLTGTYAYLGIPVINILEGIAPSKFKEGEFDKPLDFFVTFNSSSGKSASFSYGEIIFVDDALPVTLAYDRMEIRSSKEPEKYDKNIYKDNIAGLRLISPRDKDTSRYLDDVVLITFMRPEVMYNKLPAVKKGAGCASKSILCIKGNSASAALFTGVDIIKKKNWFRTGHGRGFKRISNAEGYSLRQFLNKNFPGCGIENYFLFTACDGYRCLFSGREIFEHSAGASMMILGSVDGRPAPGGYTLAPVEDYFVDRDVWGLSHIVLLDKI